MIKRNLQFISVLAVLFIFISSDSSFSQWTTAGTVSGIGANPSISVVDQDVVWVAGRGVFL